MLPPPGTVVYATDVKGRKFPPGSEVPCYTVPPEPELNEHGKFVYSTLLENQQPLERKTICDMSELDVATSAILTRLRPDKAQSFVPQVDIGEDTDDGFALDVSDGLEWHGHLHQPGAVATTFPSQFRAAILSGRYQLRSGLGDKVIICGADEATLPSDPSKVMYVKAPHDHELECAYVDHKAECYSFEDGMSLLPEDTIVGCMSGLGGLGEWMASHKDTAKSKIGRLIIQGGMHEENGILRPDSDGANHSFTPEGSQKVLETAQYASILADTVRKELAYWTSRYNPLASFKNSAATGNPLAEYSYHTAIGVQDGFWSDALNGKERNGNDLTKMGKQRLLGGSESRFFEQFLEDHKLSGVRPLIKVPPYDVWVPLIALDPSVTGKDGFNCLPSKDSGHVTTLSDGHNTCYGIKDKQFDTQDDSLNSMAKRATAFMQSTVITGHLVDNTIYELEAGRSIEGVTTHQTDDGMMIAETECFGHIIQLKELEKATDGHKSRWRIETAPLTDTSRPTFADLAEELYDAEAIMAAAMKSAEENRPGSQDE